MSDEPAAELLSGLYASADQVFNRACEAFDRRDFEDHAKAREEHGMIRAMIAEIKSGAITSCH